MELQGRDLIAYRTARFFEDGDLVNLGIGMPTQCLNFIPQGIDVWIDSENGVIGLTGAPQEGEEFDPNVVDASGAVSKLRTGGCCFDSFTSFGLIRGGHVAATVLGAYEVDQEGNLANWTVPGKTVAGMGGAMDLVSGALKVIIMTEHCDKRGNPKILKKCTLPLTAAAEVDYIVSELCVLHRTEKGLVLEELAPGVTAQDVISKTDAVLIIPETIGSMIKE
ncbi:acetate CoA/acetoacetate CoA-transferase beta subunit [Sporobacter termitidis DSM 10068]|uniref:Acetate CoA/acetoacetate CoA-transferase beta subunit n=1 Tax=Sporobacter termitidis DSM 10068 TaxID=1123282 RepID=A0A1M5VCK4_9FIRM|nr:3-oxoacid CoA-transferase subunit B [Sporobacter termitidis]SHH73002.1 acetate CoA/acetoacetate CoA-transferase beta subunit [Sporobacter termitidis DSM 10068]